MWGWGLFKSDSTPLSEELPLSEDTELLFDEEFSGSTEALFFN